MICAVCLALHRPLIGDRDPETGELPRLAAAAITVANGQAVCTDHLELLGDWQSEVHGPLSLRALLDTLEPDAS
jgi:hypothetical protein